MSKLKSVVAKRKAKLNFTFAFTEDDAEMIEAIRKAAQEDERPFGNWLRVRLRKMFQDGSLIPKP